MIRIQVFSKFLHHFRAKIEWCNCVKSLKRKNMVKCDTEEKLSAQAQAYCSHLLQHKLPPGLFYHNILHTQAVAEAAVAIGLGCGLPPQSLQVLQMAAWFHDTGYAYKYKGHEQESCALAKEFLREQNADDLLLGQVIACIAATKQPQAPKSLLEKILCDADMCHLGQTSYAGSSDLLRKEIEVFTGEEFSDAAWHRQNVQFLSEHSYFTAFARKTFDAQKKLNLEHEIKLLQHSNKT
ncbi:HD domain-containing protein [Pontibacter actiniarum]|uniref:HD domain-containing protein n=1 Tax=Pontibacter actiniarum TaxID=323450 RepID=A0A1X9YXM5_9BACT|nr:HD domain-containing protein [Pontibacter actiniarum]ARS37563.1 hypothetical protein CA264_20215 [Pontibacter actiniarum]